MQLSTKIAFVVAALSALVWSACGSDSSGVSQTCNATAECRAPQTCVTVAQGGYCTVVSCGPAGVQGPCPSDSVCDATSLLGGQTICMKKCNAQSDCRTGTECNGISGASGKVCQPKSR